MSRSEKNLYRIALLAAALFFLSEAYTGFAIIRWMGSRLSFNKANLVARVHGRPITRSQLERAVRERLWLEGKSPDTTAPENLTAVRRAALDDLIDDQLLAIRSADAVPAPDPGGAEVNERLRRLLGRFETKGEMEAAMKSQGIKDERKLRERIASRIRREKFVESKIATPARVTDEEARKWFDAHDKDLTIPERIEVRHVFIPTLDHPPEEAKAKLDSALADLTAGTKDFAALAKELSEDPATRENGGSLGWMTRARLPVDFSAPVFSLALHQPALVRSRLGWHLVEVTGRKPAEPRSFEQAKAEIIAALEAVKRREAIATARAALREGAAAEIELSEEETSRAAERR